MVRRPDSPSTMTSRASPAVAATSASRFARPERTSSAMNSAPLRVLPNPRPASRSHVVQSPPGASWFGRAQKRQSYSSASSSSSLRSARMAARSVAGSDASEAAGDAVADIGNVDGESRFHDGAIHELARDAEDHLAAAHARRRRLRLVEGDPVGFRERVVRVQVGARGDLGLHVGDELLHRRLFEQHVRDPIGGLFGVAGPASGGSAVPIDDVLTREPFAFAGPLAGYAARGGSRGGLRNRASSASPASYRARVRLSMRLIPPWAHRRSSSKRSASTISISMHSLGVS